MILLPFWFKEPIIISLFRTDSSWKLTPKYFIISSEEIDWTVFQINIFFKQHAYLLLVMFMDLVFEVFSFNPNNKINPHQVSLMNKQILITV